MLKPVLVKCDRKTKNVLFARGQSIKFNLLKAFQIKISMCKMFMLKVYKGIRKTLTGILR